MKFSFESQKYRDDFAQKLAQTEKTQRKSLLEKEKETLQFSLAHDIRGLSQKNAVENRNKSSEVVKTGEIAQRVEKRKSTKEDVTIVGAEGVEYHLEIETIDISESIPDEVKIVYDMHRLLLIEHAGKRELSGTLNNRNSTKVLKYILDLYVSSKGLPKPSSVDMAKIARDTFDEMAIQHTRGGMNDGQMFSHVIGANERGYHSEYGVYETTVTDSNALDNLRKRYPHKSDEGQIEEQPIALSELHSKNMWVNSGKPSYDSFFKPTLLIDPTTERFKQQTALFNTRKGPIGKPTDPQALSHALFSAHGGKEGILLEFKADIPWVLIGKTIFDPYHGRVMHIREKNASVSEDIERNIEELSTMSALSGENFGVVWPYKEEIDVSKITAPKSVAEYVELATKINSQNIHDRDKYIDWDSIPNELRDACETYGIPWSRARAGYGYAKQYLIDFRNDPVSALTNALKVTEVKFFFDEKERIAVREFLERQLKKVKEKGVAPEKVRVSYEGLPLTRDNLDTVLSDPDHTPEQVLGLFENDFKKEFDGDTGVWEGHTLREHTLMVMRQFKKYFANTPIADRNLFEVVLALHDIGKPKAVIENKKHLQHSYTQEIMRSVLSKLKYTEQQISIAESIINGDPIRNYLSGENIEKVATAIIENARKSGLSVTQFWTLLRTYYLVDAGSYTADAGSQPSLEHLFSFDNQSKQMDFSPRIREMVDKLQERVLRG